VPEGLVTPGQAVETPPGFTARRNAWPRRRSGRRSSIGPIGEPRNGWFQQPLLDRRFRRPGDLRRELSRLQEAVNTRQVHPWLGGGTPARHRRGLCQRTLPARFIIPTGRLPLSEGRGTLTRRVWGRGGHGAELDVPGGEEASGLVPAAGGGHRTRASHGVPERPRAEALAVPAAERLTDIEPRGRCRFPPTVRGVMRWRQKHLGDEMMRCRFAPTADRLRATSGLPGRGPARMITIRGGGGGERGQDIGTAEPAGSPAGPQRGEDGTHHAHEAAVFG
jgi:hypothetical protein